MKYWIASFFILLASPLTSAHEGHDHGPAIPMAPQGEMLQKGKALAIKIIQEGQEFKIYPLTTTLKPLKLADVKMTATFEVPRKKAERIALKDSGDFFLAKIDTKGAYRFTLDLNMIYQNAKEHFGFHIEPEANE